MILLLIFNTTILFGQNTKKDYVVLRPQNNSSKIDTIFGEIILPKNGVITKAKIIVKNEKMKYSPNKAIEFKYKEKYFASVPYNSHGNVFAERIANGKIDLCYYDSNPNGSYGGLAGATTTFLTSYYFIKLDTMENYLRIPHSREKARDEISVLFKDNERIYNQILSEDFRIWKLPDIVKEYNNKK